MKSPPASFTRIKTAPEIKEVPGTSGRFFSLELWVGEEPHDVWDQDEYLYKVFLEALDHEDLIRLREEINRWVKP